MLLIDWVCIWLHCSNSTSCTWINHSNKHGLSASFTSDHWSGDHDGQLPSYTEDLLSFHNSWLFAVIEPQKKTWFFPVQASFSYLLSKANEAKYTELSGNHTNFLPIYTANTWLRSWAHNHNEVCTLLWWGTRVGGRKSANKSVPK